MASKYFRQPRLASMDCRLSNRKTFVELSSLYWCWPERSRSRKAIDKWLGTELTKRLVQISISRPLALLLPCVFALTTVFRMNAAAKRGVLAIDTDSVGLYPENWKYRIYFASAAIS